MLAVLALFAAHAEDTRGARLAGLRAEVAALRADVQRDQADLDARLAALSLARSEAEVALSSEELALERLRADLARQREEVAGEDPYAVLAPVVRAGVDRLRDRIRAGLPFRQAERLASLDELAAGLDSGTVPPDKAATRLWQAVEDELALTRENALDRQVVTIDGQERLVAVARLGMLALYFRADDGTVGWWDGQGWTVATERLDRARVDELFTALDRRIRTGWFDLPGIPEATP
ncbi:MAG: DUF3450 family protein [Alphaproteobacteria bacterium]|nr:DUF3450 family protein [Alphaproteobacteria bacterium]